VGVTLCLTTAGDSFSRLKQLLDDITTGPLGIEFDPAGSVLMRQPPAEPLRTLYPYLRHVQIRDALRDSTGFGKEVPVGRGEVDWDELAAVLYEIEFQGWLTVLRTSGDDRQGDAKRAVSFLTNLLPG
jgi:sugar phosphate isomerase/epimerase